MPKLYEYFGIVVFFYASEHDPIHVHGEYQGRESKAEIIIVNGKIADIRFKEVEGKSALPSKQLKDFKTLIRHEAKNIIKNWVDFFVMGKKIKSRIITRRLK